MTLQVQSPQNNLKFGEYFSFEDTKNSNNKKSEKEIQKIQEIKTSAPTAYKTNGRAENVKKSDSFSKTNNTSAKTNNMPAYIFLGLIGLGFVAGAGLIIKTAITKNKAKKEINTLLNTFKEVYGNENSEKLRAKLLTIDMSNHKDIINSVNTRLERIKKTFSEEYPDQCAENSEIAAKTLKRYLNPIAFNLSIEKIDDHPTNKNELKEHILNDFTENKTNKHEDMLSIFSTNFNKNYTNNDFLRDNPDIAFDVLASIFEHFSNFF